MGPPRQNVIHIVLMIIFLNILTIITANGGRQYIGITKAPYQVLVSYQNPRNEKYIEAGGGVIISEKWLVTAAHVCTKPYLWRYKIIAGTNNWEKGGSRHDVSKIIIHPDWHTLKPDKANANDIALIEVEQPFVFDRTRQYIHLNKEPATKLEGKMGTVSGWPENERLLSRANCKIISKAECKKYVTIPDVVLCSNLCENNAQLQCGDSGGPFVVDCKLVGIMAQRSLCELKPSPSRIVLYTEISHFINWIKTYVQLPNEGGGCNIMSPLYLDKPIVKVALQLTF